MSDKIKIRWLEVGKIVGDSLLAEADGLDLRNTKISALDKLDITVEPEQKPLTAWIYTMCRENGLPETLPAPKEISNAIFDSINPGPKQFMFWLA